METILIYLSLALIVGALLMILVFGAMNAGARFRGESKMALFAFVLPILAVIILFALNQNNPYGAWTAAFVYTAVTLTLLGLLALLVTGAKSLFS